MNTTNNQIQVFATRIERLNEERDALSADIREVYSELKHFGLDPKIMRKCIALRKIETSDRQEQDAILSLYMDALGMSGTPLGDYADKGAE